ncbi:MAG: hypothetical protein ACLQPD_24415 [Desulfomonilaceae bacterium]
MFSRKCVFVVLCFSLVCLPTETFSWELKLRSTSTFEYDWYSQNNVNGFFGKPNVDNGAATGGDFAVVNGWLGIQVNNLISGSGASKSYFSTYFYPEIQVNPAVKLEGAYRVGNSDTATFPGVTVPFAAVEALWWAINLESPWGRFVYSKRPFDFGCGLQYDGNNRTEEYFTLSSQYGPLTFGLGVYPWRRASPVQNPSAPQPYWNIYDTSSIPCQDFFGFLKYANGQLETGVGGTYFTWHFGAEGHALATDRVNIPGVDAWSSEGWIYLKYNNGRFFFNTEADWQYRRATYQPPLSGSILDSHGNLEADNLDGSGSIFRPQYTEWWRWMVELGFMCGPWKASFLYAYIPGPDRRHGVRIDRQPVLIDLLSPNIDSSELYLAQQSNADLFRPYSLLLSAAYGAGLLAQNPGNITTNPIGYMVDASVLGARLDYAVASNLNLFVSAFYANRASNSGYGWGSLGPTEIAATATTPATFAMLVASQRNFAAPFPSIPDNNLGWELNTGFDWNLLQNWVVSASFGYWQPGKWFNFACIDRSVAGWDQPTPDNMFGTNPDRTIDPVFGLVWTMTCTF